MQHAKHCKKKKYTSYHAFPAADEEENQAFGYHLLINEIIIVSIRMIEVVYSFSDGLVFEEELMIGGGKS